jgi:large subunit ribosomal protein L5
MREFKYGNVMQVPRVEKVTLNIGLGEARENARAVESATADVATISGQKPVVTRAKKAIANFKIRENMPIGVAVTLRGDRMYEFLDRMLNAALPRIRDFHGVPTKAFDGRGNFSLGVREQLIFPENDYDKIDRIRGMQVNIATTARTDEEGRRLLELLGMPFQKDRT